MDCIECIYWRDCACPWIQTNLCYLSHLITVLSDYPRQIKARSKTDCCTFQMRGEITMLSPVLISASSIQQIYTEQGSHTSCLTSWTFPWLSIASIPPVFLFLCLTNLHVFIVNHWANEVQPLAINDITKDLIGTIMISMTKHAQCTLIIRFY